MEFEALALKVISNDVRQLSWDVTVMPICS
nr:MAG TPA: hypothetical protein [Caudoviricetes sp.]